MRKAIAGYEESIAEKWIINHKPRRLNGNFLLGLLVVVVLHGSLAKT
jgi:hypothetical protein